MSPGVDKVAVSTRRGGGGQPPSCNRALAAPTYQHRDRRKRREMTDTAETPLSQAITLVDGGLSELQSREIISASQVADMLLDLRLLLIQVEGDGIDPSVEAALTP